MDGREECRILTECWRKKNNKEKKKREEYTIRETGMPVKKKQRHRQARKKGKNQRIQIEQEV
jgi:hypothetical protein